YVQVYIKYVDRYLPRKIVQYSATDDNIWIKFTRLYTERANYNPLDFLDYLVFYIHNTSNRHIIYNHQELIVNQIPKPQIKIRFYNSLKYVILIPVSVGIAY
ncbi:MAG: hypothetical protein ACUVWN_14010, partial [bacterium]